MDALRQMFAAERRWVLNLITEVLLYAGIRDGQIDGGHIGGSLPPGTVGNISIDDLSDVDTTTTPPVAGDALVFDGTQWVPGAGASALTRWEPLTNGLEAAPELVFAGGEVIMIEIPL
jgi:hypothetical protein